jgi:hypothetical protein
MIRRRPGREQPVGENDRETIVRRHPAQNGSGYFVTRYDLNGAFTAIVGRQHPGCTDAANFTTAT